MRYRLRYTASSLGRTWAATGADLETRRNVSYYPQLDSSARIGWIGAGRMGSEMALRLLAKGWKLEIYNRTRSKVEPLIAAGGTAADSVAALAGCEAVVVSVSSSDDFEAVTTGSGGLLGQDVAPKVIIDSSTVSMDASARVRAAAGARGTSLLAVPVSGNPKVARAGKLTMAVSGPEDAYRFVAPLLDQIGAGATYVGEGELARLVKLCHNLFLGVVTQSMAEITLLAEKGGVPRSTFLSYLNKSVMGSMFTGYKAPAFVNLDFHATFTSKLLRKDFDLGLAEARKLEVPMPVSALVHQIVQELVGEGFGDDDFATLLVMAAKGAGMELAPEGTEVSDGLE